MNGEKRNCIRPKIVTSNPKIAVPWAGSAEKLRINVGRAGIVFPNPRVSRMIVTQINGSAAWRLPRAPVRFLTFKSRPMRRGGYQAWGGETAERPSGQSVAL